MSDFPSYLTYERVKSHVSVHSTPGSRDPSEVLFREYFPIDKIHDIVYDEGFDGMQEGTKFFNWDDIVEFAATEEE